MLVLVEPLVLLVLLVLWRSIVRFACIAGLACLRRVHRCPSARLQTRAIQCLIEQRLRIQCGEIVDRLWYFYRCLLDTGLPGNAVSGGTLVGGIWDGNPRTSAVGTRVVVAICSRCWFGEHEGIVRFVVSSTALAALLLWLWALKAPRAVDHRRLDWLGICLDHRMRWKKRVCSINLCAAGILGSARCGGQPVGVGKRMRCGSISRMFLRGSAIIVRVLPSSAARCCTSAGSTFRSTGGFRDGGGFGLRMACFVHLRGGGEVRRV